ncbi:HD domain-containing protein [Fodinibius sp. Rm-B-1B1-1]|uniref:HD domain-containing protein n=1 Tax=Fodinibius alkaliphilus TaxID=3140241 RepID=UPI003159C2B2
MENIELEGILKFLRDSERLKNTYRSSHTSTGRTESVAEHTWRLCLMALILNKHFPEVDMSRVIKICIVHDLGEAINGDIPAPSQDDSIPKAVNERNDLLQLAASLPGDIKSELVELWDEYENASSKEAKTAKALDKLETIIQHNQGKNPEDFDYAFNLEYGKEYTADHPVIASIREILDEETSKHANKSNK